MAERAKLSLKSGRPAPREPGRAPVRAATAPRPASRPAPAPPPAGKAATMPAPAPRQPVAAPPIPSRPRRPPADAGAPAAVASPQGERLSKRMTALGLASRREADAWIDAGWVRVDGVVARLGQRVQPGQRIDIEAQARHHQQRQVTILLNKPLGVVSGQAEDGHADAASLIGAATRWAADPAPLAFQPTHARGLAPAGRLDLDSRGLLVLTQDGRIARLLVGENSTIEKEYLVQVAPLRADEPPPPDAVERLRHGLQLDGRALAPARVSWANEDRLRIVLREGRKRQIRRMCELVGLRVLDLQRVRIGRIVLGALPPGQWRYLGEFERF